MGCSISIVDIIPTVIIPVVAVLKFRKSILMVVVLSDLRHHGVVVHPPLAWMNPRLHGTLLMR